jgi:xylulokinase
MSIYLGIDIGTQSVKALCYDAQLLQLGAVSTSPLEIISEPDGTREQLALWWITAIQDCLSQIEPDIKARVVALGVSGQQHGFVPLAADGTVLTPVKLWCDTATIAECEQITANFGGEERCIDEVGNAILPGYTAPKIRWLKNHRPEEYERLAAVLLPHDYVNFYLTGERAMEYGDASGTGLLDVRSRSWHSGMLVAVDDCRDLKKCLPKLIEPNACVGQLQAEVAAELGLPAGIPVSSGGGDNMMAAIGTGNVVPGRLTVSLGTSGTLFAYSDSPIVDASQRLAAFCSSTGGWLPLLCTMNCTVSTELTRDLLDVSIEELDERVASVPPGANGVMTLPFFNGERSPNLPRGKGCITGLDADNYSPNNLLRSAMESAVYGLRTGLEAFREQGCDIQSIRLTGGGSRSATWRQMVADVFNLPVTVQRIDEGAALGAVLQALWMHSTRQGTETSIAEIVDEHLQIQPTLSCEPNADVAMAYREHYQHYLRHVDAIAPLYRS